MSKGLRDEFAALALAVLDEARRVTSVMTFGVSGGLRDDFERWLPRRIGEPWARRDDLSDSVSRASHEVQLAERGACYSETPKPARGLPAAQKRLARAKARDNAAKAAAEAILPALRRHENLYAQRWLRERGAVLRARLNDYAAAVDCHQTELDAISKEPWSVGQLRENSACGLVRLIANRIVGSLDARERGDYLAEAWWRSDDVPYWDGWDHLRLAVRREAATLGKEECSEPSGSDTTMRAAKPPAQASGPPATPASVGITEGCPKTASQYELGGAAVQPPVALAPVAEGQNLPKPRKHQSRPRAQRMGKVDKVLVRLLFQDYAAKWSLGVLHMNSTQLACQIRGVGRPLTSGSLRPKRTPHFRLFRDFFRRNPKGIPLDLIRRLPDQELRDHLQDYTTEAQEEL